jgi:hypothetical protein
MGVDRRSFLTTAYAGALASLACACARSAQAQAYAAEARNVLLADRAWSAAPESNSADPRIRAMAFAILAPSAFNTQPWLVELPGDDMLILYCDLTCRLPECDPRDRMTTIGLGGFLELLRMAAAEQGYRADITLFPLGGREAQLDGRPIASVRFNRGDATRDPLFAQVLERHTCKRPFQRKSVDAALLDQACSVASGRVTLDFSNDPVFVSKIAVLASQAFELEKRTPRINQEQNRLIRIRDDEIQASPDGFQLDVGEGDIPVCGSVRGRDGAPSGGVPTSGGVSIRALLLDPESIVSQLEIDRSRKLYESAAACFWLTTEGDTRQDQVEAGRDWLRLHLKATELGLSLEPQSAALNDYPEMHEMFGLLHDALGAHWGRRVQMLGRVGYAEQMWPSARWPVESKILRS